MPVKPTVICPLSPVAGVHTGNDTCVYCGCAIDKTEFVRAVLSAYFEGAAVRNIPQRVMKAPRIGQGLWLNAT